MPQQSDRAILFVDVHGVFLSAEELNDPGSALVGDRRHQKWVVVIRNALKEAGALASQINESLLDPRVLWKNRMRLELTMPKTVKGRVVRERNFQECVNLRLLQAVAPTFMRGLSGRNSKQIARRVKQLRRSIDSYGYFLESEMRAFVHWLVEEDQRWMLYLTTAGDPATTSQLLRAENAPMSLFVRVLTTAKVGLSKSHPSFWARIAAQVQSSPDRCVVIEDNLSMGINAVKAGMSVVFLDRSYGIEDFIRDELGGKVAGVELSRVGENLPMSKQFAVCAKTPAGIKLCLQRIKLTTEDQAHVV